ncbi:cyclic-phosphate processing receiver domain-containing protein [Deinococcus soli (ex Cha et al. 2016)]|uniref:Cyclic-phosphate processing Receiver domain-containing protein n=2 Tax=Deinococcus soli (ex Cha et al. 2016) TaxID=1309411 RepID=A0AAE3XEL7_9DEIO|nr:cyclic-phosphate processing receiver domain-containing protein [Deinococcus soli (ex Cha et al. 2016)]MDR6218710.1 hypothetical protein [Deinococcus soli (ex Cha et al. 2016)]MDR6328507.1 hypothetical protein [Deinococcus soli (ex Cha et al. 2016)]MDR6753118.1 hypothetical protein [Deinococcus soli (ex Cha et al. 2016)]
MIHTDADYQQALTQANDLYDEIEPTPEHPRNAEFTSLVQAILAYEAARPAPKRAATDFAQLRARLAEVNARIDAALTSLPQHTPVDDTPRAGLYTDEDRGWGDYRLWLDDLRDPPSRDPDWVIARTYDEAVAAVEARGLPREVAFDHDLGLNADGTVARSGYDFAKQLVEWDATLDRPWPPDFTYRLLTDNPRGRFDITQLLDAWQARRVWFHRL